MTGTRTSAEPALQLHSPDGSISVIVPLLNEAESVQRTIRDLLSQDYQGEVEFILVDGGSTDGTVEQVMAIEREDRRFRVLHNPRRTTATALNLALREARGHYVARMDAHAEYRSNYLRSGVDRLLWGDVASVSGPALAAAESTWARRIALALQTWLGTGEASYRHPIEEEIEVDTGFTGMWLRSTLLYHDGWDDDTYPNEDAELAARIRATGERIVCIPEMAAVNTPRDSLYGLARQYWRYGQYRARTAVRQPNSLRRSHVLAPGLAAAVVVAPLGMPVLSVIGRIVMVAYGATILGTSASKLKQHRVDALALTLVYPTMHLAWGFGFLRGMARFGLPRAALARLGRQAFSGVAKRRGT